MSGWYATFWAAVVLGAASESAERPVWELTPYRIALLVTAAPEAGFTAESQAELCRSVAQRIQGLQGEAWEVRATAAPASQHEAIEAAAAARRVDPSSLSGVLSEESLHCDKVFFVAVCGAATGYQVTARELDLATQCRSAVAVRTAADRQKLCDAVVAAVFASFAPLARIEVTRPGETILCLRASRLPGQAVRETAIGVGDVFRPFVPVRQPRQASAALVAVAWTFCEVQQIAAEEVRCRTITGLQDPWQGRCGRGTKRLAIRVRPSPQPTQLSLTSREAPGQPLPGLEVYRCGPPSGPASLLGRAGLEGKISLPPADAALQVFLVRGDGPLLARLPIVPGLEPALTAELDVTPATIEADALLAAVQDELIDTLARRQLLLDRTRSSIAARQVAEAEELLDHLRKLPKPDETVRSLVRQRGAVPQPVRSRLDSFLAEAQRHLAAQLDAQQIESLAEELAGAKPQ